MAKNALKQFMQDIRVYYSPACRFDWDKCGIGEADVVGKLWTVACPDLYVDHLGTGDIEDCWQSFSSDDPMVAMFAAWFWYLETYADDFEVYEDDDNEESAA